jgi:RNA polymerase sigma factor (sigma-70 family)
MIYTDKQLLHMVQSGSTERDKALAYMYKSWHGYAKGTLLSLGSHESDAEDAVSDALIVLDRKIRQREYEPKASLKTFFVGICKGRLYSNTRSRRRVDFKDQLDIRGMVEMENPQTIIEQKEKEDKLNALLQSLGLLCQKILTMFMTGSPYEQIAIELELGTKNNARQTAFKCRKKLKALIKVDPRVED